MFLVITLKNKVLSTTTQSASILKSIINDQNNWHNNIYSNKCHGAYWHVHVSGTYLRVLLIWGQCLTEIWRRQRIVLTTVIYSIIYSYLTITGLKSFDFDFIGAEALIQRQCLFVDGAYIYISRKHSMFTHGLSYLWLLASQIQEEKAILKNWGFWKSGIPGKFKGLHGKRQQQSNKQGKSSLDCIPWQNLQTWHWTNSCNYHYYETSRPK